MRRAARRARRRACQLEQRYLHHDGHPVWVSVSASLVRDVNGQPLYFVCQIEDITERKASGEALAHQAIHDPLTGLPNRLLLRRPARPRARARRAATTSASRCCSSTSTTSRW